MAQMVFFHSCTDQYSNEYSRGTLRNSLEFFLCAALCSLVHCLVTMSCFDLNGFSALSPQLSESPGLYLDTPFMFYGLATSTKWKSEKIVGLTLFPFCFSGIIVLCCQCIENPCFIQFPWILWLFHRGG